MPPGPQLAKNSAIATSSGPEKHPRGFWKPSSSSSLLRRAAHQKNRSCSSLSTGRIITSAVRECPAKVAPPGPWPGRGRARGLTGRQRISCGRTGRLLKSRAVISYRAFLGAPSHLGQANIAAGGGTAHSSSTARRGRRSESRKTTRSTPAPAGPLIPVRPMHRNFVREWESQDSYCARLSGAMYTLCVAMGTCTTSSNTASSDASASALRLPTSGVTIATLQSVEPWYLSISARTIAPLAYEGSSMTSVTNANRSLSGDERGSSLPRGSKFSGLGTFSAK
mmetsp:Transcript_27861/g.66185  ORF Transcript_27861/g.66185 Transcript_27861/m.66185 type:complete len:281 (-) Transcript_27861:342-1184(-)